MESKEPLPLVSVTFSGDLRLTVLQAISVDRLFDLPAVSEYVILINESAHSFGSVRAALLRLLRTAVSEELFSKIRILGWTDFYPESARIGFYDQQILKLAVSRALSAPFYLLLDAKNHFVAKAGWRDFFSDDGKPLLDRVTTSDYWRSNLEGSFALVGEDPAAYDQSEMPTSITPFVMITAETRELVNQLEEKYQTTLPNVFKGREGSATEFLVYYAYLSAMKKLTRYSRGEKPVRTLFTVWPQESATVSRLVRESAEAGSVLFGLHRNRVPQLSDSQVGEISALWRKNLLKPWEDPQWFLGAD